MFHGKICRERMEREHRWSWRAWTPGQAADAEKPS
jgi:hypothetical protein